MIFIVVKHKFVKQYDPLLLKPGTLLILKTFLFGVETDFTNEKSGFIEETCLMENDTFVFINVQPSRNRVDCFRFKVINTKFIYIEATLVEFRKWFNKVSFVND